MAHLNVPLCTEWYIKMYHEVERRTHRLPPKSGKGGFYGADSTLDLIVYSFVIWGSELNSWGSEFEIYVNAANLKILLGE